MPRRTTVWRWSVTFTSREASMTIKPLGSTSTTLPDKLVESEVASAVCPLPDKAWAEVGEKRLLAADFAPIKPRKAAMLEEAENERCVCALCCRAEVVDSAS